jgi:glycosyltransferase involved in cell wall biosynthesis
MKVALLSRSLTRGGAQVQLCNLAKGLAELGHEVTVAAFYGGVLERELSAADITVKDLSKRGRYDNLRPLLRLRRWVASGGCEILYSFLPMENLLGLVVSRWTRTPIVWGIRGSSVNAGQFGLTSRVLYGLQFALLEAPDALVSNSKRALDERNLKESGRVHVVPNGIDTIRFTPNADLRRDFRRRHDLPADAPVIGVVARLDPMKDHATFLLAARGIAGKFPEARFVVAGDGPPQYRDMLMRQAADLGLAQKMRWLGEVADPASVYNGLDLLISSSAYGEGFSNAIAEAMSCGLPVAATDVGDSARIVGKFGVIVPTGSPGELASAAARLLENDSAHVRRERHDRIRTEFSQDAMVRRTASILEQVLSRKAAQDPRRS